MDEYARPLVKPTEARGVALIRSLAKPSALALLAGYGWLRIQFSTKPTLLTSQPISPNDNSFDWLHPLLKEELVGFSEDLKALSAASVPIFCYPNGDITGDGEPLAPKHYEAAYTPKSVWNRAGCEPHDLNRFNLHGGNSYSGRALLATIGRGLL